MGGAIPTFSADYVVAPFTPADAQPYLAAVAQSFAALSKATAWAGSAFDGGQRLGWAQTRAAAWAAATEYAFTVKAPGSFALVGMCSLGRIDWTHGCANLSFWTVTPHEGRGVATTGARAVANFGFTQLRLARLEIVTALDNLATQRVAEKLGATREGTMEGRLLLQGVRRDAALYALVQAGI